jgi:hypothetical protein
MGMEKLLNRVQKKKDFWGFAYKLYHNKGVLKNYGLKLD